MRFIDKNILLKAAVSLAAVFLVSCASSGGGAVSETVSAEDAKAFGSLVSAHYEAIDISDFSDGFNHARYIYENSIPPWSLYDTDQILGFAENMVYLQNPDGGWAKNIDFQREYSLSELKALQEKNKSVEPVTYNLKTQSSGSTMDNGNIHSQIKYLCQVYSQVKGLSGVDSSRYLECAEKALVWILNAQHPSSGGFTGADVYGVTYNDDVMTDALSLLRDIAAGKGCFNVFSDEMRSKASAAYSKGLECILRTQIIVTLDDGTKLLTAWCQQHSHETLEPIWAREFEPPSICSAESFKVAKFLMQIENPSEEIKKSITAACDFFNRDDVRIHGRRLVKKSIEAVTLGDRTYNTDQVLEDDPSAPDLWARFYALDSSFDVVTGARKTPQGTYPHVLSPVWCDRGCKYVDDFNDLSQERRNGYGYVRSGGFSLLAAYDEWKNRS